jgi:hypothetical protein
LVSERIRREKLIQFLLFYCSHEQIRLVENGLYCLTVVSYVVVVVTFVAGGVEIVGGGGDSVGQLAD